MKSRIAFTMLLPILLSACASDIKFSPRAELADQKLSSRPAPAKVTSGSDESLKKKDYVEIGWLSGETVVARCWNPNCDSFKCPADSKPPDHTEEFARKAAEHGGDLVFMSPGRGIERNSDIKKGKCTHFTKMSMPVYKWRDSQAYLTWELQDFCHAWESIYGEKCSSTSMGMVWRHDPELAKLISAIERERNRIENGQKRLWAEAIRDKEKFAALKKAYEAIYKKNYELADKDLVGYTVTNMRGERRYGYKDKAGNVVIKAQFSDSLSGFHEGLAAHSIDVKGKRVFGYIDKTGKWVIDPVYRQVSDFSEGLASVEEEGKKAGFIDKKGNFVIEPVFDHAFQFIDGKAKVWIYLEMGIYDRATGQLYLEK